MNCMYFSFRNYNKTGIPGLIGFVDGTNVAIRVPNVHEGLYVNRKGYHAQHVQIVSIILM
jgi:hypothetical protein